MRRISKKRIEKYLDGRSYGEDTDYKPYYQSGEQAILDSIQVLEDQGVKPPYSTRQLTKVIGVIKEQKPYYTSPNGYFVDDYANRLVSAARRLAKKGDIKIYVSKGNYYYAPSKCADIWMHESPVELVGYGARSYHKRGKSGGYIPFESMVKECLGSRQSSGMDKVPIDTLKTDMFVLEVQKRKSNKTLKYYGRKPSLEYHPSRFDQDLGTMEQCGQVSIKDGFVSLKNS